MKVGMVLRPGQKGTLKLQKEFGENLLCVRYRYDKATKRRLKTVEIVVDEEVLASPAEEAPAPEEKRSEGNAVQVRIPSTRSDLVSVLERRRAEFDHGTKQWRVPYKEAVRMGLRRYIVARRRQAPNLPIASCDI